MRILITYASAGSGHRRAAQALYDYIKKHHKDIDVKLCDILNFTNHLFNFFYSFAYNFISLNTPKLWGFFYNISGNSTYLFISNKIRFLINRVNDNRFVKYIEKENFDCIVSTHFFPSEVAGYLRKKQKIKSSIISIVTDFAVHPFWINRFVGEYIVALPETKNDLLKKDIDSTKVKVLGIPIDEEFFIKKDRPELAKKLGLDANKFTILIVIGMIGSGPIEKIINTLNSDIQIIVICGRNHKLCAELNATKTNNVFIYELVNNMDELMSIADLIITKAGAITIIESIAKQLPLVFIPIIGGQEYYNTQIIANYKAGFVVRNIAELKEIVISCKKDPQILNNAREQLLKISKPDVLKDITNEICANYNRAADK